MGDYTKLIVNASVKKMTDEEAAEFKLLLEDILQPSSSAYHCGGEIIHVGNEWRHRTDILICAQRKRGNGIEEFLAWLKPQLIDGMGEREAFALTFTEYQSSPDVYWLVDKESK